MYRDTLWFGLQNLSLIIGKLLQPCYDLTPGHLLIDEWMVGDHPGFNNPSITAYFNLIHQLFKQWRGTISVYFDSHFNDLYVPDVLIVHIL